jgi:hypothetical protein
MEDDVKGATPATKTNRWWRFVGWLRAVDDAMEREPIDRLNEHLVVLDQKVTRLEEEVRHVRERQQGLTTPRSETARTPS